MLNTRYLKNNITPRHLILLVKHYTSICECILSMCVLTKKKGSVPESANNSNQQTASVLDDWLDKTNCIKAHNLGKQFVTRGIFHNPFSALNGFCPTKYLEKWF